jgi:hypothetical protein
MSRGDNDDIYLKSVEFVASSSNDIDFVMIVGH